MLIGQQNYDQLGQASPWLGIATPTQHYNRSYLMGWWVKLRTANLADTFIGSIRIKPMKN